jgi:hypothetical protein
MWSVLEVVIGTGSLACAVYGIVLARRQLAADGQKGRNAITKNETPEADTSEVSEV